MHTVRDKVTSTAADIFGLQMPKSIIHPAAGRMSLTETHCRARMLYIGLNGLKGVYVCVCVCVCVRVRVVPVGAEAT